MIKVRNERDQVNVAKVYRAGQEHIFRFWDALTPEQRQALLEQVAAIDFQLLSQLCHKIDEKPPPRRLEPVRDVIRLPGPAEESARREAARERGEEAIARGKVCGLIVAGGQGTRLGWNRPKGCLPIGPVSDRTLFQLFAEQALAVARRYRTSFPLYIMTSQRNHAETVAFWEERGYFGMSPAEVFFFPQRELPAVDRRGKILMESPWRLATSPDGHGGVIRALRESGALADMQRRGIELISYWQIDNPLVRIADPVFLGYMLERGDEAAAKVARKREPAERVGVWAIVDGRPGVVEYTELGEQEAIATDENGELVYGLANLAIHAFTRTFLERVAREASLPYHIARKKVPHIDRKGRPVEPERPNGIKFECFIFDAFREARGVTLLEVERDREFAPIKNAEGPDSPASARQLMSDVYGAWLEACGAHVPRDERGHVTVPIEISPLVALGVEDLRARNKIQPGMRITEAFRL
ncbi:MAG: UDP-N-acetylhexosamine pyrophosphorylase [Planctomycetota bacterium]|nr:MAG: UDP-N-acetylhexosamine pyrophosphorylase [Planctomycetota bacterium]